MRDLQERRAVVASVAARRLLIPAVAAAVVAADQLTKTWALDSLRLGQPRHVIGPVNLVLTYNTGAAFGLGTGVTPIVEAAVVVLVVWLLAASRRASRNASSTMAVGLGLLLGGALGNLADRLFRHPKGFPGGVVDFIQGVSWWPVFNVADASIVVGVVVLVVAYWLRDRPGA
ncbi:MAG TPA: signal peptidase II [Acidimicrobiales bacterium]|nr:signal peptidase II [Acidimicrobiales bacterium]